MTGRLKFRFTHIPALRNLNIQDGVIQKKEEYLIYVSADICFIWVTHLPITKKNDCADKKHIYNLHVSIDDKSQCVDYTCQMPKWVTQILWAYCFWLTSIVSC